MPSVLVRAKAHELFRERINRWLLAFLELRASENDVQMGSLLMHLSGTE